jgi:hypothetical protein
MKDLLTLVAVAGMTVPVLAQTAPPAEPCLHFQTSFSVVIHAPYAETAPLFGPIAERVWVGEFWNPKFIYPQPPQDVQGAVFTTSDGKLTTAWVNTLFDLKARHIHYVHILPEMELATIDLRFSSIDSATTQVDAVFTRTALNPQGNEHVTRMSDEDKVRGEKWRQAIGNYLAGLKSGQPD